MKTNITITTLGFIAILFSCSELVHTQISSPELFIESTELTANGRDQILIRAEVSNQLSTTQRLTFSTTNGNLIALPVNSSSQGDARTIQSNPGATSVDAILRASLSPDEEVIISASVGSLTAMKSVRFIRSCPDEVKVDLNKTSILLNETMEFDLLFLRNDGKPVSTGTRIDCKVEPADAAEFNSIVYSDSLGKARLRLTAVADTTILLSFSDLSGCKLVIPDKTLTIK
jgi:hypothetical protein